MITTFGHSKNVSSAAYSVNLKMILILISCFSTTYLVSAITRVIGQRNFFKISRKLLSVGSFVNYHKGTVFSNAVIALHVVLFVTYLIRYSLLWTSNDSRLDFLHFFISDLLCDTVTSFAAVHFLQFNFTLRRNFMLLNSRLNEVLVLTVNSENIFSLKFRTVSDFLQKNIP